MSLILAFAFFVVGLGLVIYFAEKLVEGAVGTAVGFGLSTFIISVIFLGFDPENLAVGATGAFEQVSGIAMGSVLGASMVAIALAFGITALVAPMRFEKVSRRVLIVPILAVILCYLLASDGMLSRWDGVILLGGFASALVYLVWASRHGFDIEPGGEVAETLEEVETLSRWKAAGWLLLSLVAIVAGSELLVTGAESVIARTGLSDTVFGMTILALLVSIEELARELPAALEGRPEISYGNVVGSILAFFLFNAGIIALVRPVSVAPQVLRFYFPVVLGTTLLVTLFMGMKRFPRWAGGMLVLIYLVFAVGGYVG